MVEGAHMELASPTIANAISKCADAGAKHIIIAPYFLSRCRSSTHLRMHVHIVLRWNCRPQA